jgi:hypothetical protein
MVLISIVAILVQTDIALGGAGVERDCLRLGIQVLFELLYAYG